MSKKEAELLRQKIVEIFGKNPDEAAHKAAQIIQNWIHSAPTKKSATPPSPSSPQKVRKKAA